MNEQPANRPDDFDTLTPEENEKFQEMGGTAAYLQYSPKSHPDYDEYRRLYLKAIGAKMDEYSEMLTVEEAKTFSYLEGLMDPMDPLPGGVRITEEQKALYYVLKEINMHNFIERLRLRRNRK
jgi:hypothetical protein